VPLSRALPLVATQIECIRSPVNQIVPMNRAGLR
jgi:hypothetical protein